MKLRKRSVGSNTTADHIEVLDEVIAQIPARPLAPVSAGHGGRGRRFPRSGRSHHRAQRPTRRRVHYSIGWDLTERERAAIARAPADAWGVVLDADGRARPVAKAAVVDLTALLCEPPDGDINRAWCLAATIAADMLCWLRVLCLD